MNIGDSVDARIFKITPFGAFVKLPDQKKGLIHISQISDDYVKDINDLFKVGDKVKAKIINIDKEGKIDLTLRSKPDRPKAKQPVSGKKTEKNGGFKILPFEDKFDKFITNKAQLEPAESPISQS